MHAGNESENESDGDGGEGEGKGKERGSSTRMFSLLFKLDFILILNSLSVGKRVRAGNESENESDGIEVEGKGKERGSATRMCSLLFKFDFKFLNSGNLHWIPPKKVRRTSHKKLVVCGMATNEERAFIAQYARDNGVPAAMAKFTKPRSTIQRWIEHSDKYALAHPKKRSLHPGKVAHFEILERDTGNWIVRKRERGAVVTKSMIFGKLAINAQWGGKSASAKEKWWTAFRRRQGLVTRRITTIKYVSHPDWFVYFVHHVSGTSS